MKNSKITVIIPTYNEEHSVKEIIARIPNHNNYEIILIDDGSTDNSVKNALETDRKLNLIRHEKNEGYGAAILTGISNASGDIIVTMDSDGQHIPEEIPNLVKPILENNFDLVIGSRYLGQCNFRIPLHTRVGELFVFTCLKLLFGKGIRNNQNGFRAFKKELLTKFRKLRYKGMGFTTEFLFEALLNRSKVIEIPITANPRKHGTSYVKVFLILKSILSITLYYYFRKHRLDINKLFLKKWMDKIYSNLKHLEIFQ